MISIELCVIGEISFENEIFPLFNPLAEDTTNREKIWGAYLMNDYVFLMQVGESGKPAFVVGKPCLQTGRTNRL